MSLSLMTLVVASAGFAQDATLRRLDSGIDAQAWEAVGRINLGKRGFCTGVLIEPKLVLTAAHCLYDTNSGARIDTQEVEFLAGWRNGRASAYRKVRSAVVHPEYSYNLEEPSKDVRNDLALLELDHPVRNGRITPFATADVPHAGTRVGVVSYAKGRPDSPTLQDVCAILRHEDNMIVTTCAVDHGSSGAPIFTFADGTAQIVSIVSAKAELSGEDVSLGTTLDQPLDVLKAAFDADAKGLGTVSHTFRSVGVDQDRNIGGAKFVRP